MKILWLSHIVPYPPKGGVLQRSHNLLKQVAKRNEVHLVSLNQKKVLPTPEEVEEATGILKTICKMVEVFPIPSDASIVQWSSMAMWSYFSSYPYNFNWLLNKEMTKFIDKLSKNEQYDLIHVDTIGMIPYALPFGRVPTVLNHHNVESHMMHRRFEKETGLMKRAYIRKEAEKLKKFERAICPKCSVNLVVSDLDGVRLREIVGNVEIAVVPNGVDVEYFRPDKDRVENCKGLIFAGPMDWYPNRGAVLFFLAEIWPKLNEELPDMPVTILGKDPPKALTDAASISSITAPGFVDDVRPYIDSSKIYILDALAMEKPLVATGLAVEGLDLVEGVHYLRAESAPEFVSQIKRLESHWELCEKLALAGRRFVEERYSWEIIGDKIEQAYRKAIGSADPNYF